MHASSNEQPPRTPKYSHISLPFKILFGGVEESHTKDQMPKISAEMMGCRRRSKIATKNSKNSGSSKKLGIFEWREREEEDIPRKGASWAQVPWWRGQGPGRATWPPGPGVDPPGQPQVPPGHIFDINFYFYFSGIFLTTLFLKISDVAKAAKTSGELETVVKHMKFQKHKTLVQQGE